MQGAFATTSVRFDANGSLPAFPEAINARGQITETTPTNDLLVATAPYVGGTAVRSPQLGGAVSLPDWRISFVLLFDTEAIEPSTNPRTHRE